MPKISVIIPCYNQEKYIGECLSSLIAQSFKDWEAIIVNDGSVDNSLEIIQEFAKDNSKIRYIDQANQGVVAARNNALDIANGEYIYPLDGDDKISPLCLEKLYNAMIANKGDVIYSDVEYFGASSGLAIINNPSKLNMSLNNCVVISALYKMSDAKKYNGYDPYMANGLEDYEFWCNFITENKIFYKVAETLFYYRIEDKSRNSSFDKKTKGDLKKYIRRKHRLQSWFLLASVLKFIYCDDINAKGIRKIRIFKIPVYSKKL